MPFNSVPELLHRISLLSTGQADPERVDRFVALLDDIIARGYESPVVHFKRAESLHKLGRPEEAEAAFGRSLAIERTASASSLATFPANTGSPQVVGRPATS